ncbi:NADP-dependent oxidoreductase [Streptomyces sp. NPDC059477]|uniref:NADP-dependent oxidoreductase n=1 Tax=Streptomyces sp. NPDC059477 TaxID=3346847 RepID=UPI0036C53329
MRAVVVTEFGGPEAIKVVETPVPEPGDGQVRIKVGAAALNPVDAAVRAGAFGGPSGGATTGFGWDAAGTVDAVGAGAEWRPGEQVVALHTGSVKPLGTHAEYVVVDADEVAKAPAGVDAVHAATLPLNALTAAEALDLLGPGWSGSLLVTGAAGAVGGYAVQLAAQRGTPVTGWARPADEDLVRALGASGFTTGGEGSYDAVLDAAALGGAAMERVRDGGVYVGVLPGSEPEPERGVRTTAVAVATDAAQLAELVRLTDDGALTLRVAETYPLADAAKAHERLAEGGVRGRIVLVP